MSITNKELNRLQEKSLILLANAIVLLEEKDPDCNICDEIGISQDEYNHIMKCYNEESATSYKVEVTETQQYLVDITANNIEDAINLAKTEVSEGDCNWINTSVTATKVIISEQDVLNLLNKLIVVDTESDIDGDNAYVTHMLVENNDTVKDLIIMIYGEIGSHLRDLEHFTIDEGYTAPKRYEHTDEIEISQLLSKLEINWYYTEENGFTIK